MPQVVRWLASVFEYRAFEGSDIPYTIDQHNLIPVGVMPALDLRPPSFRMGGYFVPLVLGLFTWLVIFTGAMRRATEYAGSFRCSSHRSLPLYRVQMSCGIIRFGY